MSELKPSTMTDDERLKLITWLESRAQGSAMPGASRMYKLALDAIRAHPANDPLTLDELRGMDGDYAYFQFGDGAEGNAIIEWQSESRFILYGPVADDHSEPDIDFINMEFDDPDGHFGLHILGWLAYRRPPERSENG